ncbi:MAG: tRNA 2-thiouridine(34) synthase MnmA [Abyssibacter sp.]|uniref:tRNA 2-thiouridine(34) synthase MnmA n=1 Tax=Abyssibacter sp. TaxID=2320200 RepID=UPI003219796A
MSLVIVGLSGGVDSAVAAHRLLEAGHDVEGLFMFNWAEDETGYCQAADDFKAAQAVAEHLGIVLHRADFSQQYLDRVFQHFIDEYAAGRTPNPDLLCNREIKFAPFREHALRLGAERVATGHYADTDGTQLYRAADESKDQTYFLALVRSQQLQQVVFPLADVRKSEVRAIAESIGLPNFDRKDSTGICFIGERNFAEFLGGHLPDQPGPICDESGRTIGQHRGLWRFTIGQRRGLGIGGVQGASESPWFVCGKQPASQTLIVTQNREHPVLAGSVLIAADANWIGPPPALPTGLLARIRHRQPLLNCQVSALPDDPSRLHVRFEQPPWAIAPGQYVVFYDDRRCLGGAVIEVNEAL